jgi:hypothetical protein
VKTKFTTEQREIVSQFNDFFFEYPHLNFNAVAKKILGVLPFSPTTAGRGFRAEAKAVFDLERVK